MHFTNNEHGIRTMEEESRRSCHTDCLDKPLRNIFSRYGKLVARLPYLFIVIPFILSGLSGLGFLCFQLESNAEYLFTPANGQGKDNRKTVLESFPAFRENGSFVPGRGAWEPGQLDLVIVAEEDDGNVLSEAGLDAALYIDDLINYNISVTYQGRQYTYKDICARWGKRCVGNSILDIYQKNSLYAGKIKLTYPDFHGIFLGYSLRGVSVEHINGAYEVQSAKFLALTYFVLYAEDKTLADIWFGEAIKSILDTTLPGYKLYVRSTDSKNVELSKAAYDTVPQFAVTYAVIVIFAVVSCMMSDCVRGKPWLAVIGVLTTLLGIITGFGLTMACGVLFTSQVALMPFLALGIGVDNMFVLISSWRRSNTGDSVTDRMGSCLQDAGVSISITTLTDLLAFGIGTASNFPSVHIFCLYTGTSVLFSYLYCLTLFAGAMVLSGRMEANNKVCLCITRRRSEETKANTSGDQNSSKNEARSDLTYDKASQNHDVVVMSLESPVYEGVDSPINHSAGNNSTSEGSPTASEHAGMRFFRDYWGTLLMNRWVKGQVIVLYLAYLGLSIYGCTRTKEGLEIKHVANDDSYLVDFYNTQFEYAGGYDYYISICITCPLDYFSLENQKSIDALLTRYEETEYIVKGRRTSWLEDYLGFLKDRGITPSNKSEFVQILQDAFLEKSAYQHYKVDININNQSEITASRFFLMSKPIENTDRTKDMLVKLRQIAEQSELDVIVYNKSFIFIDQFIAILPNSLMSLGIAFCCMLVVALFLVPHPITAMWVALSILSIEVGLIGIMSFWGVKLDTITMINLILCIGFSVDFSTHVAYTFVTSQQPTNDAKAKDTLFLMGYPIFQGGVSTILGIIILSTSKCYIFRTFFKTMFLVIVLGIFHALVVLPTMLSVFSPKISSRHKKQSPHMKQKKQKRSPANDNDVAYYNDHNGSVHINSR